VMRTFTPAAHECASQAGTRGRIIVHHSKGMDWHCERQIHCETAMFLSGT
jgi:hypothetical protein